MAVIGTAAAVGLLGTDCGRDTGAQASEPATRTSTTQLSGEQLEDMLLTADDLGIGWMSEPSSEDYSEAARDVEIETDESLPECLQLADHAVPAREIVATAETDLTRGETIYANESLMATTSASEAAAGWSAVIDALGSCEDASFVGDDGVAVEGIIRPTGPVEVGTPAESFSYSMQAGAVSVEMVVIVAHVGSVDMVVAYASYVDSSRRGAVDLTEQAVEKIKAELAT